MGETLSNAPSPLILRMCARASWIGSDRLQRPIGALELLGVEA